MIILGIETSCDETAVALYCSERGLIAHCLFSQIELHQQYGGVVPEIAARDHVRKLLPLVQAVLDEANITTEAITAIGYTAGPGLIGALLVGASMARALAYGWGIPAIGVHHMEAHLMAALLEKPSPQYPFVALLVSGGHTMLVEVKAFGDYQILGQSLDDAIGEAFDKTAKMLGLPYPGGPALAKLALQGVAGRYVFPRPMTNRPGCDFSFSGLKTHAVNVFQKSTQDLQAKADIALAFQQAAIDTLIIKSKRALQATALNQLVIVGGVSANEYLRCQCQTVFSQEGVKVYFPRKEFCTDNGAMVAYTGYLRFMQRQGQAYPIDVRARWSIEEIANL
jgi:N6-L-threonylcarbamoyladenine synthase